MEQIIAVRTRAGSVMPKSADGAARSKRSGSSWRRSARVGEVVELAGPVPESGPGDPLVLNRAMRARLHAAVRCLLADKSLEGVPDSVRLAAVVLLAKAPARSAVLRLRAGEMGRWLGFSESYVDHKVLPMMRAAGVVETKALTDEAGRVTGLEWKFLPLLAARESGDPMHPLALARKDLATLLRFCEALFAPGWAPIDGPVTLPGLLGTRRGRGAATDRLALLLLALQTRPDGRVRLVGGSVKEGRGRADATVAKALGCSVSGGGKVVDRLERLQVVEVVRGTTETGQYGKGRLVLPAIASAFGRDAAPQVVVEGGAEELEEQPEQCPSCAHGSAQGEDEAAGEALVVSGRAGSRSRSTMSSPWFSSAPLLHPGILKPGRRRKALSPAGKRLLSPRRRPVWWSALLVHPSTLTTRWEFLSLVLSRLLVGFPAKPIRGAVICRSARAPARAGRIAPRSPRLRPVAGWAARSAGNSCRKRQLVSRAGRSSLAR